MVILEVDKNRLAAKVNQESSGLITEEKLEE